jgi:hypothetical protein
VAAKKTLLCSCKWSALALQALLHTHIHFNKKQPAQKQSTWRKTFFLSLARWKRFKRQSGAKFLIASTQLSLTIPFKNTQNVQVRSTPPPPAPKAATKRFSRAAKRKELQLNIEPTRP